MSERYDYDDIYEMMLEDGYSEEEIENPDVFYEYIFNKNLVEKTDMETGECYYVGCVSDRLTDYVFGRTKWD